MKRRKDAAEAKAERKRKRKAAHDKARQLAQAEGKPRPATPKSSEDDDEEASDAEDHARRSDGEGARASPPPFYLWDEEEGATVAPEEPGAVAGSSANPSLEGVVRGSSSPAAGEGSPVPQVLTRGYEAAGERSRPCWQPRAVGPTRGERHRDILRGTARCPRLERAPRGSGA